MPILLMGLIAVTAATAAALLWGLAHIHARLQRLQALLNTDPTLPAMTTPRPVIAIEILNPYELAVQETPLAGPAARLAPRIIERIVYRRTREILIEQLAERGVRALVKVHDAT